jgi:dihydroorotase-like cyclic amidohydrolase
MNPPIRSYETMSGLFQRTKEVVQDGNILVTSGPDQAVHTLKEKMEGVVHSDGKIEGFLSGCQGEDYYPSFLQELKTQEFSPTDINQIIYWNAKKVFPKIQE